MSVHCPYYAVLTLSRPWYVAAASPQPKDVILIIDRSYSMEILTSGEHKLIDIAKAAAATVVNTLNPRDRVRELCVHGLHGPCVLVRTSSLLL